MGKINKILPIILLLCFIPALWGIFHAGFFVSDDGHWMVIRLSAFYEALTSGQFPVRFLPRLNQGFGYPVADFLYPLFLYIGSVLHLLKIPFLLDVKLLLTVSVFLSGLGMYLFLKRYFSSVAASIGALFYVYLPYHLYDIYVRGSVGEVVSLAIVPFLFWAIEKRSWIQSGIFLGLLILAHNTLALFFFPIVVIYAIMRKMTVRFVALFSVTGLGLSAFFWLPALFDKQFTVFDSVAVSNPFGYFVNTVSYQLVGWIVLAVFAGIFFVKFSLKEKQLIFFFLLGVVSLFFSFSVSSPFWHIDMLSKLIQFPFRFLSLVLLSESFLAAYLVEHFRKKVLLTLFLVLLLIFSALPYLFPAKYDYFPESFYATNAATTTVRDEYMPRWVKNTPTTYAYQKISLDSKIGSVSQVSSKGTKLSFVVNMKQDSGLVIDFVYFPGWYATVDGKSITVNATHDGLIQLEVPQGQHALRLWFGETPVRLLADMISFIAIVFLGFALLIKKKI